MPSLVAFRDSLLPQGAIVLNKNCSLSLRKRNSIFFSFVTCHSVFITLYLECKDKSQRGAPGKAISFRQSLLVILKDWIEQHPDTQIFQYLWKAKTPYYVRLYPHGSFPSIHHIKEFSVLMDAFKKACLRFSETCVKLIKSDKSTFTIGTEPMQKEATFSVGKLEENEMEHLRQYTFGKSYYAKSIKLMEREFFFGGIAYTRSVSDSLNELTKASKTPKLISWKNQLTPEKRKNLLTQWSTVKNIFFLLMKSGLCPLRWHWTKVFTASCHKNPDNGCGSCDGCKVLFVQSLLVIVSAQGVSDVNILPHWGSIFRHARFA
jgi:hypothetical protein